jgi:hypothetical protein
MDERRKEERKLDAHKVDLKPYNDYLQTFLKRASFALTENISLGGVKILTDTFLPLDSVVRLEINLARFNRKMTFPGKVRWVLQHSDAHIYEMGLEFVDKSNTSITTLKEYLT